MMRKTSHIQDAWIVHIKHLASDHCINNMLIIYVSLRYSIFKRNYAENLTVLAGMFNNAIVFICLFPALQAGIF